MSQACGFRQGVIKIGLDLKQQRFNCSSAVGNATALRDILKVVVSCCFKLLFAPNVRLTGSGARHASQD